MDADFRTTGRALALVALGLTVVGLLIGIAAYIIRRRKNKENRSIGTSAETNIRRDTALTRELTKINENTFSSIINTSKVLSLNNTNAFVSNQI